MSKAIYLGLPAAVDRPFKIVERTASQYFDLLSTVMAIFYEARAFATSRLEFRSFRIFNRLRSAFYFIFHFQLVLRVKVLETHSGLGVWLHPSSFS